MVERWRPDGSGRRAALKQAWMAAWAGAAWGGAPVLHAATVSGPARPWRLATAWQRLDAAGRPAAWQAAVLGLDEQADEARLDLLQARDLPDRAHGLQAGADGSVLVVANRPGRWLARLDGQGGHRLHRLEAAGERRTLNGHVLSAPDGRLWTSETDPRDGRGWIGVRDAQTLELRASWPLDDGRADGPGIDPHQMVCDAQGDLLVAVGGIPRWPDGRRRDAEPLSPGLWRLDGRDGRVLGRWSLADRWLSLRHLAWSTGEAGAPRLGIALQAEHARAEDRQAAPLLALFDGAQLRAVDAQAPRKAAGYAGDIAAAPGGGFVLSGQKAGMALWWDPSRTVAADGATAAPALRPVAELTEACALARLEPADAAVGPGVLIGAARGLGLWRLQGPSRLLPWPVAVLPDNHLVRLADT
ncbi:MAG: hypothetical protein RL223_4468 [Pseudomonadota bacterium]